VLGVESSAHDTGAQGVDPEGKERVIPRSRRNLLHLCPGNDAVALCAACGSVVSMGRISGLEAEVS
jgi:hypothetical protein